MANAEYKSDISDVMVVLHRRVDRAVLLKRFAFQDDKAEWFPLSQVELCDNSDGDKTHTLTAPEWLLRQKGWL
jgi:hypothetical protein